MFPDFKIVRLMLYCGFIIIVLLIQDQNNAWLLVTLANIVVCTIPSPGSYKTRTNLCNSFFYIVFYIWYYYYYYYYNNNIRANIILLHPLRAWFSIYYYFYRLCMLSYKRQFRGVLQNIVEIIDHCQYTFFKKTLQKDDHDVENSSCCCTK